MFIAEPLEKQCDRMRGDSLRILISGAGVAGLSLAQLLRKQGHHPVLIERAADHSDAGYMLALMPFVDPVLKCIGVQQAYRDRSVPFLRYRLHGRNGQLLRDDPIGELLGKYGDYRGLARGELMQVLASADAQVSYSTTIEKLESSLGDVRATLRGTGTSMEATFDAVVLADGLHSTSRALLWEPGQVSIYDTGWGGWVTWTGPDNGYSDRADEVWGADFFVGIYPVKGCAGVFIGGKRDDLAKGPKAFIEHIRANLRMTDDRIEQALKTVENSNDLYLWKMTDCRSANWIKGRVALLGDAAAGFLPTAGIGAAMAMESAGVLAQCLAGTNRSDVAQALLNYESAERSRVETAQDNSRDLAKFMFRRSRALAVVRDLASRFVSVEVALRPIQKLLESAPEGIAIHT